MAAHDSAVLTLRVPIDLSRRLAREARRQRRSRSEVARDLLTQVLDAGLASDLAAEARRQSLLVRRRRSERDALTLVTDLADLRGWK